jgi:hypothetical protein
MTSQPLEKSKKIKVFISYAWESDEYKKSVKELVQWLRDKSNDQLEIFFDRDYDVTPPPHGYIIWMQQSIKKSDKVLLLCSKSYATRFEQCDEEDDKEEDEKGRGVRWEGIQIYQCFYENRRNTKFYPILAPSSSKKDIPTFLKAFDNGFSFHKSNEAILKLIFSVRNLDGNSPNNNTNPYPSNHHTEPKTPELIGPGGFIHYEQPFKLFKLFPINDRLLKYILFCIIGIFLFYKCTQAPVQLCIFSILFIALGFLLYTRKSQNDEKLNSSIDIHNRAFNNTSKENK